MQIKLKNTLCTTAIALAIPSASFADVTSQDVWASLKNYIGSFGYEVSVGAEEINGDNLLVRDMSLSVPVPDMNMRATIERLEFRDKGDGTVEITMSSDMPMSMSTTGDTNGELDMSAVFRQSGMVMIASGDPDNIQYDYLASNMEISIDKFFIEGEEFSPQIDMAMSGLSGSATVTESEQWSISGSSNIDKVDFSMRIDDAENDVRVHASGTIRALASTTDASYPKGLDWTDPAAPFQESVTSMGQATTGALSFSMSVDGSESFDLAYGADKATFHVDLSDGLVFYGGTTSGGAYTLSSADMPFPPINVSIQETAFEFGMPMIETEELADLRVLLQMRGLEVDDFLWQMIDAGGLLPRDAADFTLDIDGKVRALATFADPMAMEEMGEIPFEIHELKVNELSLSLAGAEIVSEGGFTFDSTDTETFDGLPAPTGSLMVDMFGINGLLDTLGTMGLLPPEQAMGARMMLGGFTRPGDGDDHLTSEVEVKGNGSVFINGQQMR